MPIRRLLPFVLPLAAFAFGCGSTEPSPPPPDEGEPGPLAVTTDKGPIEGSLVGSTRAFLGIPYAAPPVGDLRWKPPAPHAAWTETMKVTTPGRMCAQRNALTGDFVSTSQEDCLTVNVWTPEKLASAPRPVLVWIHGGAFTLGSGGDYSYNGQNLSETTGAVVVTLNYRLGPFGFLALPELEAEDAAHPSSGNYGIEDQRAALAWVRANAAAFGGDPGNVTVFGESAGGISVCHHLVSPESKGLFQRAIIESGPCDSFLGKDKATAQGADLLAALGCEGPDALTCLRSRSTEEIMTALPSSADLIFGDGAKWFPVLDGWNLPDAPSKLLAEGQFEKVPTIVGGNADEGSLFFALANTMIADDAAFEALAEQLVPGHGKEVVAQYPSATYGSAQKAAAAAVGDAGFVCPTRQAARSLAKAGVPTFHYHFTYAPKGALLGDIGAFHAAELKYVFGNPGQLAPQALTDEEIAFSKVIMGYWSRHAAKGDPNGEGAFSWPAYDAEKDESIILDMTVSKQAGVRKDKCDFWDTMPSFTP
ncbi:carboxylesterase/lipase family protein [Polyangium sp. y55x31]|uniref:carboxylesterase/lipase family protein n=1 Tax=Polyangium sp. y55x31 TaxID=3042688 RepID=UPI0024830696|nr:carboxylesterase/lipase family protein [Polyangium sp. y55x31]MDI1484188.1 carboxylesterase/lipase family protein [Polyangium sp. y55x31]